MSLSCVAKPSFMSTEKKILVAPLNWGLGHATRCIPIIRELMAHGYQPVLASDGQALALLRKEFPELAALELPSYEVEYPVEEKNFKWKMLRNAPKMIDAVLQERKVVKKWVKELGLKGIISDNRFGVVSKKAPSVFITHQLNVLSGNTSWLTGTIHRQIMRKFAEVWVPDSDGPLTLSGKLGHLTHYDEQVRYIGPLSRFKPGAGDTKYDLLVLLSGPEPQRTMLELLLREEMLYFKGKVLMVRGVVEPEQQFTQMENITICNFMTSVDLQRAFTQCDKVLCRSGYTTIMDLSVLGKKAFFIPTPGQYEQEYLAKKFKKDGLAPYAKQDKFRVENLLEIDLYKGIPQIREKAPHWKNLFCLFEGE